MAYIDTKDIYRLFEDSTITLHIADIDALPRAGVEKVTHCGDCHFWDTEKRGFSDECVCRLLSAEGIVDIYKSPNEFCSSGEPKNTTKEKG